MAIRKSVLMMTNTGTQWDVIGEPVRGNAYYGYTDGIHTVQVVYQNLVGGFGIQATLALDPKPEDWFWVKIGNCCNQYIMFPEDPLAPTGSNGGDTGCQAFTFLGNFVFVRAVLTREYIMPPPLNTAMWDTWQYGAVDRVLLSL